MIPARGAAFGDLFNDGKIDVIINPIDGPPVLLRNVNPDHHHWVEMKLVGGPKSPRDATCATVYLKANGMRMRQDVLASGSYISANDRRLALRAGRCHRRRHRRDSLAIGRKEKPSNCPAVDRIYTITEARASPARCAAANPARTRVHRTPPLTSPRQDRLLGQLRADCETLIPTWRFGASRISFPRPSAVPAPTRLAARRLPACHSSGRRRACPKTHCSGPERHGRHLFCGHFRARLRRAEAPHHRGRICRLRPRGLRGCEQGFGPVQAGST